MDRNVVHLEQILTAFESADPATLDMLRDSSMEEIRHVFQDCSVDFLNTGLAKFTEIEEYEWCDKIKTLIAEKEGKKIGH